jgi:hypothetical protein
VKVFDEPASGIKRLLDVAGQRGLGALEAIVACTFTFDPRFFEDFLEELCADVAEGSDALRGIPVDVVCDRSKYSGHGAHYNVHVWRGPGLFHAKLLMLAFKDRLVWLEGSLNLTAAGHRGNRELVTYHESDPTRLPSGVHGLLSHLKPQGVAAAKHVLSSANRSRVQRRDRSVTSLEAPILDGLLARVPKAREVVLVAPFFDQRDEASPTIDATALSRLAQHYPEAAFRIYLPRVGTENPITLQAHRGIFTDAFGPKAARSRVAFCGVPADPTLHAKLVAIRHGARGTEATLLCGSPNVTEAALLRRGAQANVELAREVTVRWSVVEQLVRRLGKAEHALGDCRFKAPGPLVGDDGWHALTSAVYDPMENTLVLDWRKPAGDTRLFYRGQELSVPASGPIRDYAVSDAVFHLETRSRVDPSRVGYCPIVIPVEAQEALSELPDATASPEWWLRQLGSVQVVGEAGPAGSSMGAGAEQSTAERFERAAQVRDLAARMRYAVGVLTRTDGTAIQRSAILRLLEKIFDVHEPADGETPTQRVWRAWVRIEVLQALRDARGVVGAQRLTARLRKRIRSRPAPAGTESVGRLLEAL